MNPHTEKVMISDLESMVLNHLPIRIFWKDLNSVYLGCNQLFANDAGLKHPAEIVGKTDFDLPWGVTEAERYRADDAEVMRSNVAKLNFEEPQIEGKIWLCTSKIPLFDKDELVGVLCTYEDITERKQAELELIKLREQAEAAYRAKSDFLSRMSHDLRTPLNAILGNVQLLELDPEITRMHGQCISDIRNSGSDLLKLVTGILEMCRAEHDGFKIDVRNHSLLDLLQQTLRLYKNQATEKGLTLRFEPSVTIPYTIRTDGMKLKRILGNLLSNAVKYTDVGGEICLLAEPSGEGLRFTVKDTGIGIEADAIEGVFSPFSQVSAISSSKHGVGLGLAICEKFVSLLGGKISAESEIGVGSSFAVWLPETPPAQSGDAPSNESGEVPERDILFERRVLIVDDHQPNRNLLKRYLDRLGMVIEESENGVEALEQAAAFEPEIVLMDIRMPIMDGLEATRALRKEEDNNGRLQIIAISGETFEENRQNAIEAGCDVFMPKPVDLANLRKTMTHLITEEIAG